MASRLGPIFGTAVGVLDILLNRFGGSRGNNARFSLNKFRAKLNDSGINGLWQPNRYVVEIHPRAAAHPMVADKVRDMKFLCNSAALPGIQIITSDHRRQNMGTFDRRPFGVQATDIPLTFFIDQKGVVLSMFRAWTNHIINYSYTKGEHGRDRFADKGLFEVGYRDEYLCDIDIFCLDQKQENIIIYHLYEAFPMQVGDVTTAWAETDNIGLLPVQFTFRTYDITYQQISAATETADTRSRNLSVDTESGTVQNGSAVDTSPTQPIQTGLQTQTGGTATAGIGGRPIKVPG